MSQPTNPIATLSHFIAFHDTNIMVYMYQNELFVPIKAIAETIGIDWSNVRRSVQSDDNQKLYGTITLTTPIINNFRGAITMKTNQNGLKNTENDVLNEQKTPSVDILCIRLERVEMFIARINTGKVRSAGNQIVADYLLEIQQEWGDALHNYETYGIAVKKAVFDSDRHLNLLVSMYNKVSDKEHKVLLARRIDKALGYVRPNDNDQLDIFH